MQMISIFLLNSQGNPWSESDEISLHEIVGKITHATCRNKAWKIKIQDWIAFQPMTTVMLPSALPTELLTEVSCMAQGQKSVYT